jgi:hypothetical protein
VTVVAGGGSIGEEDFGNVSTLANGIQISCAISARACIMCETGGCSSLVNIRSGTLRYPMTLLFMSSENVEYTSSRGIMADQELMVTLKFLDWQELYETEKPFQIFTNIPDEAEDKRTSNLVFEDVEIAVHNVRGREKDFDLDANGFRFLRHVSILDDFHSQKKIEDIYLKEVEILLRKEVEGVDKVFIFDWRV